MVEKLLVFMLCYSWVSMCMVILGVLLWWVRRLWKVCLGSSCISSANMVNR